MDIWEAFQPALPPGINEANIDGFKKKEFLYLYSVDKWYQQLKDFTFETEFVELRFEEAEAMIHAHGVVCGYDPIPLSETEENHMKNITSRIGVAIEHIRRAAGDDSAPVFAKLNHRSPKDVAIEPKNMKTRFCLRNLLENIDPSDKLSQTVAVSKALVASLACQTAEEAMELLLRSNRVRMDLGQDKAYKDFFKSCIVIRRYYTAIDPSLEFRAFVRNHRLTALSQYEEFYYPHLPSMKNTLFNLLTTFFDNQVAPIIAKSEILPASYVVDFAVIKGVPKVIEINPFHSNTAGSLFSWKQDREVILNGPLEFRIVESEADHPAELIPPYLQQVIDEFYAEKRAGNALGPLLVLVGSFVVFAALSWRSR